MKKNKFCIVLTLIIAFLFNSNVYAKETENVTPQIYGQSAITVDMQTGEIIYEKNIDTKIYPASTTKLMTAILLTENKNKTSFLKYTKDAKLQPAASLNDDIHSIDIGDTMSAVSAMDALLLYSANDIAYMIAENISGNTSSFAAKMNKKANEFGLKNTHFVTPNGLHNADHYSTAYDMSIIAKHAFGNPWIKETMSKHTSTIKTSKGIVFPLQNRNKLLGKNGCIGGKTGYTIPAGRCLVAIYERSGRKILGVVMKSIYDTNDTYVFGDMEKIIDWSYNKKASIIFKKNSIINYKNLKYKPLGFGPGVNLSVPVIISEDVRYYENPVNKNELKEHIYFNNITSDELEGTSPIGTLNISQRDYTKDYKLYSNLSKTDILKKSLPIYILTIIIAAFLIYIVARKLKHLE
ncbi:D-alanyl-D-alanine carboxypeptidase family protein [Clostridium sp. LBM24168]